MGAGAAAFRFARGDFQDASSSDGQPPQHFESLSLLCAGGRGKQTALRVETTAVFKVSQRLPTALGQSDDDKQSHNVIVDASYVEKGLSCKASLGQRCGRLNGELLH